MPRRRSSQTSDHLRSLLVWLVMALVLALGLIAHAPAAHAWLHASEAMCEAGHDHGHGHAKDGAKPASGVDEHRCAVTVFAQGVQPAFAPVFVVTPLPVVAGRVVDLVFASLGATEHLLPPGRGPPQDGSV